MPGDGNVRLIKAQLQISIFKFLSVTLLINGIGIEGLKVFHL